jgi:hypothetical protein
MEGSGAGSVLVTNGSGCGARRPKNTRILQIRIRYTMGTNVRFCANIALQYSAQPHILPQFYPCCGPEYSKLKQPPKRDSEILYNEVLDVRSVGTGGVNSLLALGGRPS